MGRIERPIRGSLEVATGRLTRHALHRDYTRVYRDVYVRKGTVMTALIRALAAAESAGPDAILVGKSAAAMYFTKWLNPGDPAEVSRAEHFRAPPGVVSRRYSLAADEVNRPSGCPRHNARADGVRYREESLAAPRRRRDP